MHEWYGAAARDRYEELESEFGRISPRDVYGAVRGALERQAAWVDRACVNLNAAENVMNPRAVEVQSSICATRPSLGHAGEKYETGLRYSEVVEHLAASLARRLFGCAYAEIRPPSGAMANLFAYMACAKPGDVMLAPAPSAGGHATHQPFGTAGLYGLRVVPLPWDAEAFDVELSAYRRVVDEHRPRIVLVGASLLLKPYDLAPIAEIAHEAGATVVYDAAHMAGVIAGGCYPSPLAHGADVLTMSTYKMYGGPAGGMLLTNDRAIAERVDEIAYPGMTANFDVARVAALSVATADLIEHGGRYARACIANAQALAAQLERRGVPVHGPLPERTLTHHLAVDARGFGGGNRASLDLEPANVLTTGIGLPLEGAPEGDLPGLRIGTQVITRWGMTPAEMEPIAAWISRVLVEREDPAAIAREVEAFRRGFQTIRYIVEAKPAGAVGAGTPVR